LFGLGRNLHEKYGKHLLTRYLLRMLYEFHKSQNELKPGTIHATYLIYGVKRSAETLSHTQDNGDVEMTSSMPEVEEPSEHVPVYTLTLASEEGLVGMGTKFRGLTTKPFRS
jgi:hypothetical protein